MSKQDVTFPHFWAVLEALPIALLYKENTRAAVFANQAALTLFRLPAQQNVLSVSQLQQVPLLNPDNKQAFDLLHNPLLLALSGTALQQLIQLNNHDNPLLLQSTSVALSFTLHSINLVTLQPMALNTVVPLQPALLPEQAEIEEALAFDKLMSLISTQLINVQDDKLDQHIEDALAAIGEFCHADRSYVFLFNTDFTEMSNTHEWVRSGISSHKAKLQHIPRQALPYFYQKIQQDLVFAVNDVTNLPTEASAEQQEFIAEDIQSVLCCAMLNNGKLSGFVGCDMVSRQRSWTGNDLRRMKLVGEMIANTLQNVSYRRSLQQMQQQLLQVNLELQKQASQDGLTGIANRRQFDTSLQNELQRCARNKLPLGLLLLDIDRFKLYNDHYGHQAGDDALKCIAQALNKLPRRKGELAARYGGEEFAIILPGSDTGACTRMAKQIQQQLTELAIEHQQSDIASVVTASIGITASIPNKHSTSADFISAADKALYKAKANGRNQFIIAAQ